MGIGYLLLLLCLCGCHAPTTAAVTVPKSVQFYLDEDEMNPCRVQEALAVHNCI